MVWYFVAATYAERPPPTADSEIIAAVRRAPIFMICADHDERWASTS
jgi:hypothetical protein